MSTQIDSLDIEIKTSAGQATDNIEKLAAALEKLKTSSKLGQTAKNLEKLSNALNGLQSKSGGIANLNKLSQKMNSVSSGANDLASSSGNMKKGFDLSSLSLMAFTSNVGLLIGSLSHAIQVSTEFLAQAIEWDGIQFRFGRAFGEDAEETYAYIQKINEALGINIQQFMQYSSLYGSLLSGFGMAQEKVTTISVGLTELSYDIWAAYNDRFKTLEAASEAVRSAITGEIEPIRNAGIALTEASLQEFIDQTHLAGVSIEKLTEAQKSEVRYAAMVNAAMNQGIVGTYAREMQTAEGAVRSLSQSFKGLVQAIGSLFIPVLQLVVPYVTAFIELITEAVFWLAKLFNIPIQKIDWGSSTSGVGGIADGAKDATEGLDSASKAAKKLRDYTMGFDELNVISPDTGASNVGGAGAAGASGWGEGLDLKTLWDDSVFADASARVDEIKEKIKSLFKEWGLLIGLIGAAFLGWKFGKTFLAGLQTLGIMLKALAGSKGASAALKLFGFEKLASIITKLRGLLLKTPIGALILGTGEASVGAAIAAVLAVVAAIASLVAGFVLVYKESENFREGLKALGEGTVWVFEKLGELISFAGEKLVEFGGFVKDKLKGIIPDGLLDCFSKLDIGIGDLLITAGGLALFGPWGLLIEGAVLAIKGIGLAAKDSIAPVDLLGDGISKATKEKVEPFIKEMDELEVTLNRIDWGNAVVSESDLNDISTKLKSITNAIVNELDGDKNEALKNIEPLRNAMSEEKFAELQVKIEKAYSDQKDTVLEGETRINEIIKKASEEARALTDEEAKEINGIRESMKETGIKYLSDSETESNLILTRLKDNATKLTATQASETIKSAITARDDTIAAAKEQYDGILLEAQRLLDAGVITKEEYDGMVKTAETAKDDSITAAETQYSEILRIAQENLGEYARYVDTETGEIKSNWEIFCEDVEKTAKESWENIKAWWGEHVQPKFTAEYWKNKFDVIRAAIKDKLAEVKDEAVKKWGDITAWFDRNIAPKFTKEYWLVKFNGLKEGFETVVKNAMNAGIDKINNFISRANEALKLEWDAFTFLGKEIFPSGSFTLATIPTISRFENGGFIEDGLFTMNRGEIAGKFNNGKSVVANNEQIIAGISEGVYSAVVAAMAEYQGGGERPVVVYLDGKQIYSSMKRTESRRGLDLMGNQVGYVY